MYLYLRFYPYPQKLKKIAWSNYFLFCSENIFLLRIRKMNNKLISNQLFRSKWGSITQKNLNIVGILTPASSNS